jgi:hypothetical protein
MILPVPVPAPTSFHALLQDPTSTHSSDITTANAARATLRTVLKGTKKDTLADGRGADWTGAARVRCLLRFARSGAWRAEGG